MSAFDYIVALPVGTKVWLTADGYEPMQGEIGDIREITEFPGKDPRVVVWTGSRRVSWLELTAMSDIEYEPATCRIHVH